MGNQDQTKLGAAASGESASTDAIKHYCSECGSVMQMGVIPGTNLPAWVCPECGNFDPV